MDTQQQRQLREQQKRGQEWVFIIHDSGMVAAGGHVAHVVKCGAQQ